MNTPVCLALIVTILYAIVLGFFSSPKIAMLLPLLVPSIN